MTVFLHDDSDMLKPADLNVVCLRSEAEELGPGGKSSLTSSTVDTGMIVKRMVPKAASSVGLSFCAIKRSTLSGRHLRGIGLSTNSELEDVAIPFEISVDRLTAGNDVVGEVDELIQELSRDGEETAVILRNIVSSTGRKVKITKVGKSRNDVSDPFVRAVNCSERLEERDERARDLTIQDVKMVFDVAKEFSEHDTIAGIDVNAHNLDEPEKGNVELRDDWQPGGGRAQEAISREHHLVTETENDEKQLGIRGEVIHLTTLFSVHAGGSDDLKEGRDARVGRRRDSTGRTTRVARAASRGGDNRLDSTGDSGSHIDIGGSWAFGGRLIGSDRNIGVDLGGSHCKKVGGGER